MFITNQQLDADTPYTGSVISVESQLSNLGSVGFTLAEGADVNSLMDDFTTRDDIQNQPYLRLVERMAGWALPNSNFPLCPRLWMDDTECIYDPDAYAQILRRLQLLSSGKPELSNISGDTNIDAQTAKVSFEVDGSLINWEFGVDGNWLNADVFTKYSDMLSDFTGERLYYVLPSEPSQEFIVACLSDYNASKFAMLPNIRINNIQG